MIRTGLHKLFKRLRNMNALMVHRLLVISSATLLVVFLVPGKAGIRINTTPSLPLGLYISGSGQLIEFCPSKPYAELAAIRGYRSTGSCPDGASPLMKPVIAREGDIVEVSRAGLSVNGQLIPNTAPLASDTKGRLLDHWPFGVYVVLPQTIWVASSYNARSFDSRYFGPVSTKLIRDYLEPLVTLP